MNTVSGDTSPNIPGVLYRRRVLVVHNGIGGQTAGDRATVAQRLRLLKL